MTASPTKRTSGAPPASTKAASPTVRRRTGRVGRSETEEASGPYVLAVANQKGGVAKTTTVASLGAAFAEMGKRVLLIDLDAQACLTFSLGVDPDTVAISINEVLIGQSGIREAIVECADGVHLVPSVIDLAGAEAQLLGRPGREFVLRTILQEVSGDYDIVLLDCSPSLGVLTLAALTAASGLLIPMPCEMLSHRGIRHGYAVRGQQRDHAGQPGGPGVAGAGQLGGERAVGRVDEVAEQVDRPARALARDLDPRDERDAQLGRGCRRRCPAGHGVVVGERERVEPGWTGVRDERGGRLGPVRAGRVGVQVDAHRTEPMRPCRLRPAAPRGSQEPARR